MDMDSVVIEETLKGDDIMLTMTHKPTNISVEILTEPMMKDQALAYLLKNIEVLIDIETKD